MIADQLTQEDRVKQGALHADLVTTAWDLCGTHAVYWDSGEWDIFLPGSDIVWDTATRTRSDNVRLSRIVPTDTFPQLKQIDRYVRHDQIMVLRFHQSEEK